MAFAANSSIFGVKPATAPTGTGMFGQQQPAATGSNIFGQSNPQQGTSLFGQPAQQQAAGSSLFGQSTQQPNQQPAGSNLFGQSTQQSAQGNSTSLFGQPAQQQTAGAGTSLFGQPAQQPATGTNFFGQSAQQPSTGASLFGQPAQQPATGGSLFGQPAQNNQQATGTGLFGQSTQGTQPNAPSLFGQPAQQQQQQQQQQQGGSLFGGGNTGSSIFGNNSNAATTNTGGFGTSTFGGGSTLFGQKPAQPQQSTFGTPAAQQPSGPPPFSKTTKFNDLPDDLKKVFEQIDSHIQGRIQISKDLQQRKLGEEATKGQELIRVVQKDLSQTNSTIRNDLHFTRDLRAKVDQAVHDTIIATRIVDGFKSPQLNGAYLKDHASFPLEFFTRVTNQIRERLVWYRATIEQIERKLSSMANQTHVTPQGITTTLQAQHSTFLSLASKTAALDAELHKIKTLYTQLWRARTGSVRDPFDSVGISDTESKPDLGLSGLSVR